jgi:hypothetical protein
MAINDLAAIGNALYGPRWQTPLAEALGVSDRTVRRWVAGQPVPDGARRDMWRLCAERGRLLIEIADRM